MTLDLEKTEEIIAFGFCRGLEKCHQYIIIPPLVSHLVANYYVLKNFPNIRVGDRIKINDGIIQYGTVMYFGMTELSKYVPYIQLELDRWSPNAGNGSLYKKSTPYCQTLEGYSYFVNRHFIQNIEERRRYAPGDYVRLKGLIRVPKFNGKTVKIINYVEKKGRWKVKFLHAENKKCFVGVREEYFSAVILDSEPLPDFYDNRDSLKGYPCIGDVVKTKQNLYGTVMYVGNVEFSSIIKKMIGLKLKRWNVNGKNGIIKNKKYFHVEHGYGYFVELNHLIENIGSDDADMVQE